MAAKFTLWILQQVFLAKGIAVVYQSMLERSGLHGLNKFGAACLLGFQQVSSKLCSAGSCLWCSGLQESLAAGRPISGTCILGYMLARLTAYVQVLDLASLDVLWTAWVGLGCLKSKDASLPMRLGAVCMLPLAVVGSEVRTRCLEQV